MGILVGEKKEMEEYSRKDESYGASEEEKLELRLGPPDGGWSMSRGREDSLLSFRYFSNTNTINNASTGGKRGFMESVNGGQAHKFSSFLQLSSQGHHHQGMPVRAQESSQPGCNKGLDVQSSEKKAFSPPAAPANTATAVPNTSQKRYPSFSFSFLLFTVVFLLDRGYSLFHALVADDVLVVHAQ